MNTSWTLKTCLNLLSQDIATFVNNNLLFQTFITSTEPANNVLDRGSQFNTGEGKIDRKVKIYEPRELCHSSKRNWHHQKSTASWKHKMSQNYKGLHFSG